MARAIPTLPAPSLTQTVSQPRSRRRTLRSIPWKRGQVRKRAADIPWLVRITIPRLNIRLDLRAALKDQELRLKPIAYWEGAVRAQGTAGGKNVKGSGYLEMTGYAGPMVGIQAEP